MNSIIHKAPVLHQFVQLLQNKKFDDSQTFHQAKRVVADTVGVAYGGSKTKAFQSAMNTKSNLFGEGDFPIWGTNDTADLNGSVFLNALAVSSTDFDEGHRKAAGHPASVVVPAAIMLGKELNKPYVEILKSVIVGYEAGTRFAFARYPEKIESYSTGRWGGIASAATVAYLRELSTEEFMHAISLAYVSSPGMQGGSTDVSTGSMLKEGVAWAAQSGFQSVMLAQQGFTGPYLFIDEYDDIDKDKLLADKHENWLINSNYFKPYACCRWLHTAIHVAQELKSENDFKISDIDGIEVSVFSRANNLIDAKYPENTVQAQFHLPFTIAAVLVYDQVTPDIIAEDNLSNSEITTLIDKIRLIPDKKFDAVFPGKIGSGVTIRLNNGMTYTSESTEAPWDTSNPPTDEELFRKFEKQVGLNAKSLWKRYLQD